MAFSKVALELLRTSEDLLGGLTGLFPLKKPYRCLGIQGEWDKPSVELNLAKSEGDSAHV